MPLIIGELFTSPRSSTGGLSRSLAPLGLDINANAPLDDEEAAPEGLMDGSFAGSRKFIGRPSESRSGNCPRPSAFRWDSSNAILLTVSINTTRYI